MNKAKWKNDAETQRRGDAGTDCLAASLAMSPCRHVAASLLIAALCLLPIEAASQRTTRHPANVAPQAQSAPAELSPAAKTALDAAVAALGANALVDAERSARAAVQAAPRSAIT